MWLVLYWSFSLNFYKLTYFFRHVKNKNRIIFRFLLTVSFSLSTVVILWVQIPGKKQRVRYKKITKSDDKSKSQEKKCSAYEMISWKKEKSYEPYEIIFLLTFCFNRHHTKEKLMFLFGVIVSFVKRYCFDVTFF